MSDPQKAAAAPVAAEVTQEPGLLDKIVQEGRLARDAAHGLTPLVVAVIEALNALLARPHSCEGAVDERGDHRQDGDGHQELEQREASSASRQKSCQRFGSAGSVVPTRASASGVAMRLSASKAIVAARGGRH